MKLSDVVASLDGDSEPQSEDDGLPRSNLPVVLVALNHERT